MDTVPDEASRLHVKSVYFWLTRFTNASAFWRGAVDPAELYMLPLNRSGDAVTQVAMVYGGENYSGVIKELGIAFFNGPAKGFSNNNDVVIRIASVELRPFSAVTVVEQIFKDWVNPPLWQGCSNNSVRGIHHNGMVFPNLALNLRVATLALILLIVRFGIPMKWRIEHLIDTHERYAGLPLEERIRNDRIRCGRFPEDCRAGLLPYF